MQQKSSFLATAALAMLAVAGVARAGETGAPQGPIGPFPAAQNTDLDPKKALPPDLVGHADGWFIFEDFAAGGTYNILFHAQELGRVCLVTCGADKSAVNTGAVSCSFGNAVGIDDGEWLSVVDGIENEIGHFEKRDFSHYGVNTSGRPAAIRSLSKNASGLVRLLRDRGRWHQVLKTYHTFGLVVNYVMREAKNAPGSRVSDLGCNLADASQVIQPNAQRRPTGRAFPEGVNPNVQDKNPEYYEEQGTPGAQVINPNGEPNPNGNAEPRGFDPPK